MYIKNSKLIRSQISELPLLPGVYRFLNSEGVVIYVGKAKNLRKRVSSYFVDSVNHTSKVRIMVGNICAIEHIVVDNEQDALLLENNLIKSLKPHYNVLLKDDKSYPWIVVRNESFPRIESTRRMGERATYFGPYSSLVMQKTLLELLHAIFPLRICRLNLSPDQIARGKYSTCLQFHIGNCNAPCIGRQSEQEYGEYIASAKAILKGDLRGIRTRLKADMEHYASIMAFEKAEVIRQKIAKIENYTSKSVIINTLTEDFDIFSILIEDGSGYCNYTKSVGGAVVNSFTCEINLGIEQDQEQILSRAIESVVEKLSLKLGKEVIVPFMPIRELSVQSKFVVPQRGDKLELLRFSQRSIKFFRMEQMKNMEIKDPEKHSKRIMATLRTALRMSVDPAHIECFDNSNLQGTVPVAACVVFRNCKPSKREYRHFNIKTVVGSDDFASMREVIHRRYSRLLEEGGDLPNLIVVDGGKGQLSSAYGVLKELGLEQKITIVGLAKRIEEIFFPNDPLPYYLERGSEALKVVMHLRDEAHRFGITFHRQKRSKAFITNELQQIEGIGEATATKLLRHFKTVFNIKKASVDELSKVVGKSKAEKLLSTLAK